MDKEFESQAGKYEYSRKHFRSKAQHDFLSVHKKLNEMIITMNDVVARHMYFISGKPVNDIENGDYFGKLIVSFTRTHFILYDLIVCNELIDASVLYRKQLELVCRLFELEGIEDPAKLINRTPNVKHLEFGLNKLYSDYSSISHSANPENLKLLGSLEKDGKKYISVYPLHSQNSLVALHHLFLVFTQYHYWIADAFEKWFSEYSRVEDCAIYAKCHSAFSEIYYDEKS